VFGCLLWRVRTDSRICRNGFVGPCVEVGNIRIVYLQNVEDGEKVLCGFAEANQ